MTGCSTTSTDADQPAPSSTPWPAVAEELPVTGPPRLPYVDRHALVFPGGRTLAVDLPLRGRWGISSITRDGGDYLVTDDRYFEGSVGMYRLDRRGRVLDAWTSTGPALPGPDETAAWVSLVPPESGESGPALILAGPRTQEVTDQFFPHITSFDGQTVAYSARVPERGRRVVTRTFVTDLVHAPREVPKPPDRVVSPGGRHWFRFRRDELVIGSGAGQVAVPSSNLIETSARAAWEDDKHLLATWTQGKRQAIVRIDLDGSVARASEWMRPWLAGFAFLD
ncbi:MAG: hypothetical protein H0X12_00645 [Nocardioides sp.]|nr:hypothetical protein [Nocardioides sp.]